MKFPVVLTKRIIAGLVLIYLSGLGWVGELTVPFLPISHKIAVFTALGIIAEVCFFAGAALIGKPVYRQLKDRLIRFIASERLP